MDIAARRRADPDHRVLAGAIRMRAMKGTAPGHCRMSMDMADPATMPVRTPPTFDVGAPDWFHRDRFALLAGISHEAIASADDQIVLWTNDEIVVDDIDRALTVAAITDSRPTLVDCRTATGLVARATRTDLVNALSHEARDDFTTRIGTEVKPDLNLRTGSTDRRIKGRKGFHSHNRTGRYLPYTSRDHHRYRRTAATPAGPFRLMVEADARQPWNWFPGGRGFENRAAVIEPKGRSASHLAAACYPECRITNNAIAIQSKAMS